jgi:hypothetical protein
MDRSMRTASVVGAAVRVGVGRALLVEGDAAVDVVVIGDRVLGGGGGVGVGDDVGLNRPDVVVDVQPAVALSAASAAARTSTAGFTTTL